MPLPMRLAAPQSARWASPLRLCSGGAASVRLPRPPHVATPAAAAPTAVCRPWHRTALRPPRAGPPASSTEEEDQLVALEAQPRDADAADSSSEPSTSAAAAGSGSDGGSGEPPLVPPARRLQPALGGKERSALRTEAETMARDKKLVQVQVGEKGVTPAVLASAMDVLAKRSFVRLRIGIGGSERKELASELEALLDAVCVHQIGHTITLYRQQGLLRPADGSCSGGKQ